MTEDAGAADLIAGGRLQLGIGRGSHRLNEVVCKANQVVQYFDASPRLSHSPFKISAPTAVSRGVRKRR